jgi:hypothetical protein
MNRCSYLRAGSLAMGLLAATPAARAQTDQPWCGAEHAMGTSECVYRTLQECTQFMRPDGGYCTPNPNSHSTGAPSSP